MRVYTGFIFAVFVSCCVRAQSAQSDILMGTDFLQLYPSALEECIEAKRGAKCDGLIPQIVPKKKEGQRDKPQNKFHPQSVFLLKDEKSKLLNREITDFEREGLQGQVKAIGKTTRINKIAPKKQLLSVAKCLLREDKSCKKEYQNKIVAFKLAGLDGKGKVQFTGYFVPVIMARKNKSSEFAYPLFRRPSHWKKDNGPHATREEIDKEGILDGQGLEIGWTDRPLAIFDMQMQGSGIASFEDGTKKWLLYDGKNGHEYVNLGPLLIDDGHLAQGSISLDAVEAFFKENPLEIEKYLYRNPSFVFFKASNATPKGSLGTTLLPGHSIAVDPNIIPLGSVLIGRVPVLDDRFRVVDHEIKLLFAQDTGAQITGPGHVDLFTGIGDEARKMASRLRHYGELWLLLPK